jgi:acyl-CoA thioesterase FadM
MKKFNFEHKIYFEETNAVGGVVYFSNYVKWQGMVREEYFLSTVPEWKHIMQSVSEGKLNMLTVEEHSHFIRHAYFGDMMLIDLQTSNLKTYSFDMIIRMYRNSYSELAYYGWQRLAFDDFKGSFIPIPKPMLMSIQQYQIPKSEAKQFSRPRIKETSLSAVLK